MVKTEDIALARLIRFLLPTIYRVLDLRFITCVIGSIFFSGLCKPVFAESKVHIEGEELCQGKLDSIYFSGNQTTKEIVFRQEMTIAEHAECSLEKILESRQNMMDLGIFSSVKPTLIQYPDRLILQYRVKEKHYILPIPRISRTSDGEIRLGIQLRMDNFSGLNHQLKLTSEKHAEEDGAGRKGFEHAFEYNVPRFENSLYGISVKLEHLEKQYQLKRDGVVFGESDRAGDKFELRLHRRRDKSAGSRGWQNSYRFRYEIRGHHLTEGELGPFEEGQNLEISAALTRQEVHLDKYRRRGFTYGGELSFAFDLFGADYSYQRFDAFYRGYRPIDASTLTNFNYNVEIGYSNGKPFGERAFSLGGGDTLRGLAGRTIDGDIKLLANLEYLSALKSRPAIRWVVFWDIANTFPRWEFKPARTETGLGTGIRWKIVSFVKVDLRVDFAFSLSEKKLYSYFATKLNF